MNDFFKPDVLEKLDKINTKLGEILKHLERKNGKTIVSGNVEDFTQQAE